MPQLNLFGNLEEVQQKPALKAEKPAPLIQHMENAEETKPAADTAPLLLMPGQPAVEEPAAEATEARTKRGRKSFKEMDAEVVHVEVPDDEELFQKQYYAISEVAKWFHVNQSLLRYWENEFSVLKPRKTRKGDRLFRPEDVKNLQVIYYLLRQRKFSIEGAKQYLKENSRKADNQVQIIKSLTKLRAFLLEWRANLEA